LRRFGRPDLAEELEAKRQTETERENTIEVEPENVNAVRVFLAMRTQWQRIAIGGGLKSALMLTGLRYEVLPVLAGALGITIGECELHALQIMEREAIRIDNERQRRGLRR
jgi:hypothetical protein